MTSEATRTFLLWCTVIDYGILLVWFLVFVFATLDSPPPWQMVSPLL